jgi:hypothetical protein
LAGDVYGTPIVFMKRLATVPIAAPGWVPPLQ